MHPGGVRSAMDLFDFEKSANLKHPSVHISAGHLFWIYRQLIGMSYIALARQVQTYRNISDPLGRLGS